MRTIIVMLFVLAANSSFAQNTTNLVDTLLSVYKTESIPYLKKFSEEKLKGKNDQLTDLAIYSKYNALLAKTQAIESNVKEVLKSEKIKNDKLLINKIIEKQYEDTFVGLPKEYWDSVSKKVNDIQVIL